MTAEKEFGTALYELAKEENKEDAILEGLTAALDAFAANPEYEKLLCNPAINKDERIGLIDKAFGDKIERYAVNFLKILCERTALQSLAGCIKEFRNLLYNDRGILPVLAKSAIELSGEQKKNLTEKLAKITGKTILLTCETDAALIAGIRISYSGVCYDDTVKQRFESLQKALLFA
ncbi:MAG: ATP synthase F1 subunit delta [Oscillospiraceae bacterium]